MLAVDPTFHYKCSFCALDLRQTNPDLPMALASGQWMVIVRDNQAGLDMNMARQVFNQLSDLNFGMCLFFVVSV